MRTQHGDSIAELSRARSVLLVFLRHFGCTFCREALADIAGQRDALTRAGVRVVMVHMTTADVADPYFEKYGLAGVEHVGDEACAHYRSFGLLKGNFNQLFGLRSWVRGFGAGVVQGHGVGYRPLGDGFQMPGAFIVRDGQIAGAYRHRVASDRPDYWELLKCCEATSELEA